MLWTGIFLDFLDFKEYHKISYILLQNHLQYLLSSSSYDCKPGYSKALFNPEKSGKKTNY